MDKLTCRLGFWSAITIVFLVIAIDVGMILTFLLVPQTMTVTSVEAYAANFSSAQMLPSYHQ